MKKKFKDHIIYNGCGFPVKLSHVEMIFMDGKWHPKIDVKATSKKVIEALITENARLTGNQIRFIRSYLNMSLREFAEKIVNKSHTAVSKWEKMENLPSNMDINIEKILRLSLRKRLCVTQKQKNHFFEYFLKTQLLSQNCKATKALEIEHSKLKSKNGNSLPIFKPNQAKGTPPKKAYL